MPEACRRAIGGLSPQSRWYLAWCSSPSGRQQSACSSAACRSFGAWNLSIAFVEVSETNPAPDIGASPRVVKPVPGNSAFTERVEIRDLTKGIDGLGPFLYCFQLIARERLPHGDGERVARGGWHDGMIIRHRRNVQIALKRKVAQ